MNNYKRSDHENKKERKKGQQQNKLTSIVALSSALM